MSKLRLQNKRYCNQDLVYFFKNYTFLAIAPVGLHPTCLQALCLHSFMTEEEPGVSDRDFSGLVDREDLTRLKHGPRTTPTVCWKQQARHSKRLPVIVGTDKCKREGHSGGQRTGEAGTGRAGDIQRAREQPSWMAWSYRKAWKLHIAPPTHTHTHTLPFATLWSGCSELYPFIINQLSS